MRRLVRWIPVLLLFFLVPLIAQQFPPDGPPIQPPTKVLWVEVVPDVFIAQDVSQQIDVLWIIASSVTTSQTTADSLCNSILARGNEVLANDPGNISRLNKVGCKLITYTSVNGSADLAAISTTSGSLYAQGNQWRNELGADLIQFVTTSGDLAGQGYQCAANAGAQWGYTWVNNSAAVGNYSGIHEMGHNLCLQHDAPNGTPSYPYGLGFCPGVIDTTRRDPMVYPSPCGGNRVSYFGNPNISPFGYPFGNASNADNARVWREKAAAVAAFRSPVPPPTCPTITLTPTTIPNGYTGRIYHVAYIPGGGTTPYTFAVTAGSLPPGLALNTALGILNGTPTTAGTYNFSIRVQDATSCATAFPYSLVILQLPSAPTNLTAFTPPQ